jgi:hypothetical protein
MDCTIKGNLIEKLTEVLEKNKNCAMVCPHLQIRKENVGFLKFFLTYQTIEMFISHLYYKKIESNFGIVFCSPGACSLLRFKDFESGKFF